MARPGRFSPEVRERAVRMVFEHAQDHASPWAAITSIAEKIGCAAENVLDSLEPRTIAYHYHPYLPRRG